MWKAEAMNDELSADPPPATAPVALQPSSFILHPFQFAGGVLFCYVIAGFILGSTVLAAWAWKLPSGPRHRGEPVAPIDRPSDRIEDRGGQQVRGTVVGRVTKITDCQWADPSDAAKDGAFVPLGRKFALVSGNRTSSTSPAHGRSEGPADYEVDTP